MMVGHESKASHFKIYEIDACCDSMQSIKQHELEKCGPEVGCIKLIYLMSLMKLTGMRRK